MDLKNYALNSELCEKGRWFDYPNRDGKTKDERTRLKIASTGSRGYQVALRTLLLKREQKGFSQKDTDRFKDQTDPITDPIEQQMEEQIKEEEEILISAVSRAILLDWENLRENGIELEYSMETAYRILKQYSEFRDEVIKKARDLESFRLKEKDLALKKSSGS